MLTYADVCKHTLDDASELAGTLSTLSALDLTLLTYC
jgi:hypothetical protein